ncbi:MAG: helix-hairpin-helix domain-containing protein [Parasporobacterium sp.]|nr:helix-hairpin-helix domain-containing protein [Parasporobacterium sp.]
MIKNKKKILPAVILIIAAGIVFCCLQEDRPDVEIRSAITADSPGQEPVDPAGEMTAADTQIPEEEIWVYVSGCVKHPGVYLLHKGARIFEAVELAGGMTEEAAKDAVNLAGEAADGQQIRIPQAGQGAGQMDAVSDLRININTASEEELRSLPGIGAAKAQAIIAYRTDTPFRTIEEIMNVSGIKEGAFEKIRDLIRV